MKLIQRLHREGKISFSAAVKNALYDSKPIVALESTIISHGMPYPENLNCAIEVEEIVSANGATPATIAILEGKIHIGMDRGNLLKFADLSSKNNVLKASSRDIAPILVNKQNAGTTVAATMFLAQRAQIQFFATGGIGGVHRNAFVDDVTLDVSADLIELSKTNMAVFCSGIKSILDVPRTLEYLETHGVTVGSYVSEDFPLFFTNYSGIPSPLVFNSIKNIAEITNMKHMLGSKAATLIGIPNPEPMNSEKVEEIIRQCLEDCSIKGIQGKAVTPYLLQRLAKETEGSSLKSNISLIKNNAAIAAQVASTTMQLFTKSNSAGKKRSVWVVGGANEDITVRSSEAHTEKSSNIVSMHSSVGGVALNMCSVLSLLTKETQTKLKVSFVSSIGDDAAGSLVLNHLAALDIDSSFVEINQNKNTGRYIEEVTGEGELVKGFADVSILDSISLKFLRKVKSGDIILLDANLSPEFYAELFASDKLLGVKIVFEPTSVVKAKKLLPYLDQIDLITPNEHEIKVFSQNTSAEYPEIFRALEKQNVSVLLKRGQKPPVWSIVEEENNLEAEIVLPKLEKEKMVNTKGCGDTFVASFVFSRYIQERDTQTAIAFSTDCAHLTAQTTKSFSNSFEAAFR